MTVSSPSSAKGGGANPSHFPRMDVCCDGTWCTAIVHGCVSFSESHDSSANHLRHRVDECLGGCEQMCFTNCQAPNKLALFVNPLAGQ